MIGPEVVQAEAVEAVKVVRAVRAVEVVGVAAQVCPGLGSCAVIKHVMSASVLVIYDIISERSNPRWSLHARHSIYSRACPALAVSCTTE